MTRKRLLSLAAGLVLTAGVAGAPAAAEASDWYRRNRHHDHDRFVVRHRERPRAIVRYESPRVYRYESTYDPYRPTYYYSPSYERVYYEPHGRGHTVIHHETPYGDHHHDVYWRR